MNGTTVTRADGSIAVQSKNLRGMRDYARVSRVSEVHAAPDPANSYRGILRVQYADGAKSEASFACYTVLLEWLTSRQSWHSAQQWTVEKPDQQWVSFRTVDAWASLHKKGLAVSPSPTV